ncbi:MAG: hypothetical protein GXO49_05400, partial [Chlorobi bacterium]|nr:hypothetical protein [Chlorobiota bacterium]
MFSVEANDWAEGDSLGTSSAIADTVAVFGAPGKDSVGAVYVYRGEDDVWEEIQKLTAS